MRSGSKLIEKSGGSRNDPGSGRVSPLESELKSITSLIDPFIDLQSPLPVIEQYIPHENVSPELKLKTTASKREIVAAMRSQKTGFSLIKS